MFQDNSSITVLEIMAVLFLLLIILLPIVIPIHDYFKKIRDGQL